MDVTVLACGVVTFVLLWFMLSPLMRVDLRPEVEAMREEEQTLTDQRQRCVQVLRDLELDFETQKIVEADYLTMKSQVSHELAQILGRLDGIHKVRE